jgi:CRP-like cAMP-binding protein
MAIGLLEFLNQYTEVTAQDFEILMSKVEHHSFEKKTVLTNIGEVEQRMYYVLQGLVRKYFFRGKNEINTHIVKEGGIIGSGGSFLTGLPSRYIVETLEPVTLLSISREKLEEFMSQDKKYERIVRIMLTHYFLIQEQRILDNIRFTTRERFIRFMHENPELVQRVPQKQLASYLKIKPETFSRLKHLMINRKNKIKI